ncbi:FRIGIDA-like protein 1 isoform X2 [Sorghum bicolor]|uniref:FRIGIDA-like protein 1 isoform X2 n=1 Tax=Sorghum bicolor TaxID=4558 RepID=UPI000B424244|nr:FRIGIDA-like protein 1 isoform X2 [Sorghum bicolor]|eukprot:XP_021306973.1 FRIGIDA-like protein 1 isoform X2 [Sorghum bicolor]
MADATPSIPSAIASLQAYSTALSAFTAAWRAVETHASSLDSTLAARLAGYTELELICSAMDGAGLLAYLTEHRDELKEPARALDAALQVAPDPGLLVLSAAATFCRTPPEKAKNDGSVKASCRLLMALLDRLRAIGFKPSPEARDEARAVAADWKRGKRIGTEVMFKQETFAFLHLVGVFGLVEDVGGAGEVLDLVVSISGRERAVEAFLVLGLDLDQHMPIAGKMIRIRGDDLATQNAADAKERTLLGTLQKFIKEQKLEELPIFEEANKRMAHLDQQSAERKRTAAAAAAAAQKVSKNIEEQQKKIQELMQPAKRPRPENVVQGSLGQNVNPARTSTQQFKPQHSIHKAGVSNQYQAALTQNVLPAINQISQLVAGSHRPVGIQNQAIAVPPQYGSGSLASYYGVTSTTPYRSSTLAPGPGALNGPSAQASSRSKLYSGDPLAAVSRSSDKKGSSYKYSLSSMSTYDHK